MEGIMVIGLGVNGLRKASVLLAFMLFIVCFNGLQCMAEPLSDTYYLRYSRPASNWEEALPIGNGMLGGMVFGGVDKDRFQFNEISLCTGSMTTMGNYQPFGDVMVDFDAAASYASQYSRTLSLDSSICRVSYDIAGAGYSREYFASHPDRIVVMRYRSSGDRMNALVTLSSAHGDKTSYGDGCAFFEGRFADNGLEFAAQIRVMPDDGKVVDTPSGIRVEDCSSFTILLSASTSFVFDYNKGFLGNDPVKTVRRNVSKASGKPFPRLLSAHVDDYKRLYGACGLSLSDPYQGKCMTIPERLASYKAGGHDPWLEGLLFQYGRYLFISSSRKGSLPANLQGLWNKEYKPAWYSQYTTNINLEMNYWLAEPTGLGECHLPLLDWVENIAEVQKHSNDPRLKTDIAWKAYSTMNFMGGNSGWAIHLPGPAWMLQHFWMHYAYTGDMRFLRERAYPLLKEMAEFWASRLIEKDGKLVTPDGWSPEHGPGMKEGDRTPYPGVSYDQEIVYDLFTNYINAADVLGVDTAFKNKISVMRERLLWPRIGRWGQLQEWMDDVDSKNDHHRHFSHLFAVHPGHQISPVQTPELVEAALVSLRSRGNKSTGWSTAWRINMYARLFQPEEAHMFVRNLITRCMLPNMFDVHPPFQIDGNFGYSAGIVEMLLQNIGSDIYLLPALPSQWQTGAVRGLRAYNGAVIDMVWREGRLVSFTISSMLGGKYRICVDRKASKFVEVLLSKGKSRTYSF